LKKIIIILIFIGKLLADYNNYTLRQFANIVATQNNINIVIDNKLNKKFSFIITKPIKYYTNLDVFTDLLDKNGFELQYRKTYYIIIKKADKRVNKIAIFKTKYINAQEAVKRIRPILKSFYRQHVKAHIISSSQQNKFMPTKEQNTTSKPIYKDFSLNYVDDQTIVLTYKDKYIKRYTRRILANIDTKKKQLTIIARIYEINTQALAEKGINLSLLGETHSKHFTNSIQIANSLPILQYATSSLQINSLIRLLKNKEYSTLLSTPKLRILEGFTAIEKNGKTYPIVTQNTVVSNSSTTTQSKKVTYIDIGIVFKVKYNYSQNGYNYISIDLQRKDLLNYNPTSQDIITTTRQIKTDIRIKDNNIVVIAGLGRQTLEKKAFKVPYLSQIPLIGQLLQYKYRKKKNTSIVITLEVQDPEKISQVKKVFRIKHAK